MKTIIALLFMLVLLVGAVSAADGDYVATVNFDTKCQSGIGVGIAFDGENLWYSCVNSDPDLFRANPVTGAVTASYNIAGGLGALSYDAGRNAIWAGYDDDSQTIRLIQLDADKNVTGTSTAFTASIGGIDLLDGIAYDAEDDSLYLSSDVSSTIYHLESDGDLITNFGVAPGSTCGNSGLAVGGQLLYEGFNGCNQVIVVDKSTPGIAEFDFATGQAEDPTFRDEDLECDTNTFAGQGLQVMWSVEAYDDNRVNGDGERRALAFEIPTGSCGIGGEPAPPPDNVIPEFAGIGLALAAAGAGAVVFFARKRK